ncbi:uncharacterized protein TNCT_664071 [Trichonephila clavata]|uniref:SPIN-DOC-like zinc-finger domain-containing protein n=1 Tax=Trichonephila clavata TaxID=2740835 RepID=A0A8X6LQA1_TRICU|nr:uncharacterized protein TNCT_664071 [Trichonephila clavata]
MSADNGKMKTVTFTRESFGIASFKHALPAVTVWKYRQHGTSHGVAKSRRLRHSRFPDTCVDRDRPVHTTTGAPARRRLLKFHASVDKRILFECEVTLHDMDLSEAPLSKYSKLSTDKSDSRSSRMLMTFVEEVKRKKPKNYRFHYEWESEFLFTMSNGKCTCLICHATVAISKKSNLRRHFTTMHKNFNEHYPRIRRPGP